MRTAGGRRASVWWTVVPIVVVVVIAAVVTVLALRVADEPPAADVSPRPALVTPTPAVRPVDATAPEPTPAGVTAQISAAADDPALGTLTGEISDALTGQTLWASDQGRPMVPASATKILTAAAALATLPLDKRITTSVVAGADGRVVLVGGGDPTLSVQPDGTDSFFTDAPRIADLAAQIERSGVRPTSVAVDTGLYTGTSFAPTWERADIAGGSIAPIQSVMADSGRIDPDQLYSPRSATPAVAAGQTLAVDLGVPSDTVTEATAPQDARVLATVQSAPLQTRLRDMLVYSDDVLAETIALEVAQATGAPMSLDGASDAVRAVLTRTGLDTSGVVLRDTNGLSYADRIPAAVLDEILRAAAGSAAPKLRPLVGMLPISGASGTLADRFGGDDSASGAGWIRAKTGTLTGVNSLAGIVQTTDNRVLTFAFLSNGTDPSRARPALDTLAARLRACGCR